MTDSKTLMSTSYKIIFIFAIGMAFLSLLGGSKTGIGTLLWGYTAWLMYKRNNSSLTVLYKVVFWFDLIFGGIGFVIIATNEGNNLTGYSLTAYTLLIFVAALISFGLMKFFASQLTNPISNVVESTGIGNLSTNLAKQESNFMYPVVIIGTLTLMLSGIFYFTSNKNLSNSSSNVVSSAKAPATSTVPIQPINTSPKVVEPCRVYWNGRGFLLGSTKGDANFESFSYAYYGVEAVIISLPTQMVADLGVRKKVGDDVPMTGKFKTFMDRHWGEVSSLCHLENLK